MSASSISKKILAKKKEISDLKDWIKHYSSRKNELDNIFNKIKKNSHYLKINEIKQSKIFYEKKINKKIEDQIEILKKFSRPRKEGSTSLIIIIVFLIVAGVAMASLSPFMLIFYGGICLVAWFSRATIYPTPLNSENYLLESKNISMDSYSEENFG